MSHRQRSVPSTAAAASRPVRDAFVASRRSKARPDPFALGRLGVLVLICCVWAWLALQFPAPRGVPVAHYLFVALFALAARALPIVNTRERPITFFGAVVCAGSALIGPWAAGALAGAVFAGDALLFASRRAPRFWRAFAADAAFVVATVPLAGGFYLLNVAPPLRAETMTPGNVPGLLLAAVVYFGSVVLLRTLAARITRAAARPNTPAGGGVPVRAKQARVALGAEAAAFAGFLSLAALPLLLRPGALLIGAGVIAVGGAAVFLAVRQGVLLRTQQVQVEAIRAVSAQAVETQNEDALFASLLSSAQNLIGFDRAYLWATVPGGNDDERLPLRVSWPPGAHDEAASTLALGEGLAGRAAARRRGVVIAGSGGETRGGALRRAAPGLGMGRDARAALAVPLVSGDRRAVGVALFLHAEAGRYVPADLRLIQSIANVVAGAVENVRLHQSIRVLAITDGLTDLANRRRLNEIVAEESWRARRYGRPFSVILCDIDDFKRHNDTFGHLSGDAVLRDVAGVLVQGCRAADTVARYGGEEFCIVLPETDRTRALVLAERLRTAVAATPFAAGPNGDVVYKTMSFGVAAFPEDAPDPEPLLGLADQALYHAKKTGKNRVEAVSASAAPAAPPVVERNRPGQQRGR